VWLDERVNPYEINVKGLLKVVYLTTFKSPFSLRVPFQQCGISFQFSHYKVNDIRENQYFVIFSKIAYIIHVNKIAANMIFAAILLTNYELLEFKESKRAP
jgi:hypothetical protein